MSPFKAFLKDQFQIVSNVAERILKIQAAGRVKYSTTTLVCIFYFLSPVSLQCLYFLCSISRILFCRVFVLTGATE